MTLFRAHFTGGETISDVDTLVRLAGEAGLDEATARVAIDSEVRDLEVAGDIQEAAAYGIHGVPYFRNAAAQPTSSTDPSSTRGNGP